MNIRVIGKKEEMSNLSQNDTILHISFQPSIEDLFNLVQRYPKVKAIELSKTYHRIMCESLKMYLELSGIQLLKGNMWGHRGDVNKYYKVPDSMIETIKQLKKTGRSKDEIVREVSGTGKFSEDLLRFIVGK